MSRWIFLLSAAIWWAIVAAAAFHMEPAWVLGSTLFFAGALYNGLDVFAPKRESPPAHRP